MSLTKDQVISWFLYDPNNPLLFSTSLFLGLFIAFYFIYIITKKFVHFRMAYVLLFSLFFYYKVSGFYFLLLFSFGLINYILSTVMSSIEKKSTRKGLLVGIITFDVLVLFHFNYTDFFIKNINLIFNQNISSLNIIFPIGLSFFVFQSISYSVDLYRKQIEPISNALDFSFFLCFFPRLLAGPIVRAKDFIPQMYSKLTLSKDKASMALFMILSGLIKKSVISDYISQNFVDRIFDSPLSYTPFETLMASYGYALQIYCDFSGYSDMAIGLALLMGFTIPENFHTPYKSASISEFWHRWHIALSTWLRDYLYIPLGGNRKGKIRTYVNLMLTMLIGGFWHGAAFKYIIWGGLHGGALCVERFFRQFLKIPDNFICRLIGGILTFHFVVFCWIFFKASDVDSAFAVLKNISYLTFKPHDWLVVTMAYKNVFFLILIGFILHFLPQRLVDFVKKSFNWLPFLFKALAMALVFWLVYATASSVSQPFIYFQF